MAACAYRDWIDNKYRCPLPAWEGDGVGYCICHSRDENKPRKDFRRALAEKQDYDFRGYVFPEGIIFIGRELKDAVFGSATFSGTAGFRGATFSGAALFDLATFSGAAGFGSATFSGAAGFGSATFSGAALFDLATFSGAASFDRATFSGAASFGGATFEKSLRLEGGDSSLFRRGASFDNAHLPADTIIRHACLRRASFVRAFGLDQVEFDLVDWAAARFGPLYILGPRRWPGWLRRPWLTGIFRRLLWRWPYQRHNVAYDEITARRTFGDERNEACQQAERVYRELRRSYEERKHFAVANDFHFGEMEMRRLRSRDPVLTLYGLFSGYGTRPLQALVWLLLVVLVFCPLAFGVSGGLGSGVPAPEAANYAGPLSFSPDLEATTRAVVYSLRSAVLQPERDVRPLGVAGPLAQGLEFILGPLLIALTTLSLNRKFRR